MPEDRSPTPLDTLTNSPSSLLENDKYSDIRIECGDQAWQAHKAVICSHTEYFARACDGDFKVSK